MQGFTLLELSMVLVIIGLIVGGILVGQDLIHAAKVRQQVSQIERINSATNTFRVKFSALPGDISVPHANRFGLPILGIINNRFDNGFVDGQFGNQPETFVFFLQLKGAGLMECTGCNPYSYDHTSATYDAIFTTAKINERGVMHVYGGRSWDGMAGAQAGFYGDNRIEICGNRRSNTPLSLTPQEAYALDIKLDDGLPLTGTAKATDSCTDTYWGARTPSSGAAGSGSCVSTGTTPSSYNTQNGNPLCNLQLRSAF